MLANQCVLFSGIYWRVTRGLATGVQAGVYIANVVLSSLDDYIQQQMGHQLFFQRRFVDDFIFFIFFIFLRRQSTGQELLEICNSYHGCINVKRSAVGKQDVPFLDLSLSLGDANSISHTLFRKQLCLYHYVPRASCHRRSVYTAVILGEAKRILRRCMHESDQKRELHFFKRALLRRGYGISDILKLFARAQREHMRTNAKTRTRGRTGYFKVIHSSAVNYGYIRKTLRRLQPLTTLDLRICAQTQKNLFRLLYPITWRRAQHADGV